MTWRLRRLRRPPTCKTQYECTALINAASQGHTECVRLLLEAGAAIDVPNVVCNFILLLYFWVDSYFPRVEMFSYFLIASSWLVSWTIFVCNNQNSPSNYSPHIHGADSCICQAQDDETALNRAARLGHTDCVQLLVQAGANKEAKSHVRGTTCDFNVFSSLG